ncbi:hypothetical protein LC724_31240 [Blautia sp. RD014234]|nr:hypothetical protein [Blautia parvula]
MFGGEDELQSEKCLYIIRKNLGKDFLVKESGDIIRINPALFPMLDTDLFLKDEDNTGLYRGDFLEGFYLKNNVSFNEWVTNTRQVFKAHYLKNCTAPSPGTMIPEILSFVSPSAKNRCR